MEEFPWNKVSQIFSLFNKMGSVNYVLSWRYLLLENLIRTIKGIFNESCWGIKFFSSFMLTLARKKVGFSIFFFFNSRLWNLGVRKILKLKLKLTFISWHRGFRKCHFRPPNVIWYHFYFAKRKGGKILQKNCDFFPERNT